MGVCRQLNLQLSLQCRTSQASAAEAPTQSACSAVGFLGDGINDALALRHADVGRQALGKKLTCLHMCTAHLLACCATQRAVSIQHPRAPHVHIHQTKPRPTLQAFLWTRAATSARMQPM